MVTLAVSCAVASRIAVSSRPVRWATRFTRLRRIERISEWLKRADEQPILQKSSWALAAATDKEQFAHIRVVLTDLLETVGCEGAPNKLC